MKYVLRQIQAYFKARSGPITAMIGTDRQGYVPGELIAFSAEVGSVSTPRNLGREII